ncbi:DUF362 domain-containing protein [Chloroflexota bacterium]
MKQKVALTRTGNRSQNIDDALRLLDNDIDLKGKSRLFIKVNFVSIENQLAATHIEATRGLLKFLRKSYNGSITIGESTLGSAHEGFEKFGYLDLVKEFDVGLVDLNEGNWEMVSLYDSALNPMELHYSSRLINSDYRIAIGPPKTHDTVGVTLSIKNLAMGGLSYPHGDKRSMHQGYPVMNLNLYLLNRLCSPHLSIIDGFVGMEGDGPVSGAPVDWGIAVASIDPVAADSLAAQLMGFNLSDIGYLTTCMDKGLGIGEISKMEILGEDLENCRCDFHPHSTFRDQKNWRDERIDKILGIQPPSGIPG